MRCLAAVLPLFLVSLALFGTGCPMEMARPVLVEDGVFGFEPRWWSKNVAHVQILTRDAASASQASTPMAWIGPCGSGADIKDSPPFTTQWAARAVTPVSARDFRLIPGQTPTGFEQVLPADGGTFTPVASETYYILVCLEPVAENFGSLAAIWTPGQVTNAPWIQNMEVAGPFTHEASGMGFPTEIGWFKRTDLHRYDSQSLDVSAGYLLPSRREPVIATVYVYPIPADHAARSPDGRIDPGRSLRAHYEETIRQIRKAHDSARVIVVSEQDTAHDYQGRKYVGRAAVFEFEGPWAGSTEPLRSYLYLFGPIAERWMIKYRFTHPQRVNGSEDVQEFLRQYTWTLKDL
jgi:hypothetical protein